VSALITSSAALPAAEAATPRTFGKTAKVSALWDFSARISGQWVMFGISIFLARLLTPADYGITAAARLFITLASRVTQLGLNASLVRMKDIRPEHVSSVFIINLVAGVLAFVVLSVSSTGMGRFFDSPEVGRLLPVAATVFLIVPFGAVPAALLQRNLRFRTSTVIAWCDAVSGSVFALGLAWLGWGYWSLIVGALGGTVLSTVAKIGAARWRPSLHFSPAAFRETLSFGLGLQAKRLLSFATTNMDNLVVGKLLGVVSLGFYDKGYGLMSQVSDRMTFDSALMRIFSIIRHEPERFRRALLKGVQATTVLVFPILMVAMVSAEHIVPALFGSQWTPAIGPFRVLAVVGLVRTGTRPLYAANESLGFVWQQTGYQAISVAILVLGVAVGSRWGLTVASVGVLVAALVDAGLNGWLITRDTTITGGDLARACVPSLAIAGTMALAVLGVNAGLATQHVAGDWTYLLSDVATAAVLYPALLLWAPFASIRAIVRESIEDVAPGLRRWLPVSE
jgi:O-antigen/teichoic acid export membrane protein